MKSVLKACFVLFSICLLSYPAAAQNQKRIDSLLKVLPKYKDDTNKVIVLYDLGWETSYRNLEEGLRYAEQALSLATKLKYEDGQVMAFHDIGSIYVDLGDFQKANEYLFKELRLLESTKSSQSAAL
jgi:tetratricopeptide (TPR) repeat protein